MIDRNETENEQAESFPLGQMMRNYFRVVVREALYEVFEGELTQLCGLRHHPATQSPYRRAGSADSAIYLEGRREALKRPRVRHHRDGERRRGDTAKLEGGARSLAIGRGYDACDIMWSNKGSSNKGSGTLNN